MLKGVPASSGIGIGKAVVFSRSAPGVSRHTVADPAAELCRFARATDIFCTRLSRLTETVTANFGSSEAGILTAQIMIVNDPDLQQEIKQRVESDRENIEFALSEVFGGYIEYFSSLDNELLRARTADFKDIIHHLLDILSGKSWEPMPELPQDCVLIADDLPPTRAAMLQPRRISAIVDACGTPCSHTAIMARAARIPTVVSTCPELLRLVHDGDELIVDGGAGEVIHLPTPEEVQRYRQRQRHHILIRRRMESYQRQKTLTRDNCQLELSASLGELGELSGMVEHGVDGLLVPHERFFDAESDEQRLFLSYRSIARAINGLPLTICAGNFQTHRQRSLGSDQPDSQLHDILTALLRVSALGKVRVIISGITTAPELRQVRRLLERCKSSLLRRYLDFDPSLGIGVAVETTAVALCAHTLVREADFLMVCADSLTRHTLTADFPQSVPGPYNNFHPAVLQLLCQTIQTAGIAGIPAYVCGKTAADPMMLPFLVGCGASGLSVPVSVIAGVRDQISNLSQAYWRKRVPTILTLDSPEEVAGYLKKNWSERGDG